MNTASIVIRTNPAEKAKAQDIVREWGVSLSSVIDDFLRHLNKYKSKTFKFNLKEPEYPNVKTQKILKKAEEDRLTGRASPIFDSTNEMIAWLHKEDIKDSFGAWKDRKDIEDSNKWVSDLRTEMSMRYA